MKNNLAESYRKVAARANALLRRIPLDTTIVGAEIGVFIGGMSCRLLDAPYLYLFMIDSWLSEEEQPQEYKESGDFHAHLDAHKQGKHRRAAKVLTEFAATRRHVLAMTSEDASKLVRPNSLDFVFIDAVHTYNGCKQDIALWEPKVKLGGLLCGHDYRHPQFPGVTQAVDEYSATYNRWLELDDDYTWFTVST